MLRGQPKIPLHSQESKMQRVAKALGASPSKTGSTLRRATSKCWQKEVYMRPLSKTKRRPFPKPYIWAWALPKQAQHQAGRPASVGQNKSICVPCPKENDDFSQPMFASLCTSNSQGSPSPCKTNYFIPMDRSIKLRNIPWGSLSIIIYVQSYRVKTKRRGGILDM